MRALAERFVGILNDRDVLGRNCVAPASDAPSQSPGAYRRGEAVADHRRRGPIE